MFIEALGDAGVKHGLPRAMAYRLASQMVAGTGRMQVETGAHPGAMKDAVCSPAARPLWAWRSWSAAVCARLSSTRWTPSRISKSGRSPRGGAAALRGALCMCGVLWDRHDIQLSGSL